MAQSIGADEIVNRLPFRQQRRKPFKTGQGFIRYTGESISQIGRVMGIETIAEYVENPRLVETLRNIGVDYAQGYGIARPVPVASLAGDLAEKAC